MTTCLKGLISRNGKSSWISLMMSLKKGLIMGTRATLTFIEHLYQAAFETPNAY